MSNGPLERPYGKYYIVFRKADHTSSTGGRATPHVEVWKGRHKIGNFDMATGTPLGNAKQVHVSVKDFIRNYLTDPQVKRKVKESIESSFFDLSKPAGQYGGIPKGFSARVSVEVPED